MTIGNWSSYVASLGIEEFNSFMYNKVQLYVPDLSAHYKDLKNNNINMVLRLSKSSGATEVDTAHIGVPIAEAAEIYELVGPSSSLTSSELKAFTEWR